MQLTVLGSGAACPAAGSRSSGYLVTDQDQAVLLDCGQGVAPALLSERPDGHVDHIIISHMHVDHFIDLLALRFRLVRDLAGIEAAQRCTTLHLPPGGAAVLSAVLRAVSFREDFCTSAFQVQEYDPQQPLALGTLRAHFAPARHYIPAWAVRLEGGASLTYSGDTAPSAAVTDLARGSDLFLCEATLSKSEDGARRGHCTPAEAAAMARDAEARRLLLTHFWFETDLEAVERQARTAYEGPLQAARDGLRFHL